jgi:hypothetical protein
MARSRAYLDERRAAVADPAVPVNGIEFLEVDPDDQTRLTVGFLKPLPGEPDGVPDAAPLAPGDIAIRGGDRITGIRVTGAEADGSVLTVTVDRPGDFSTYTLAVEEDRAGFDPILREIEFSFKAGCPTDSDCAAEPVTVEERRVEPHIDYLGRDYESFRRVIFDRMATLAPAWTDRNPADVGVTLVELLAYVGDYLSYRLDAVDTEAYLDTARLRTSARRHALITGYAMHDGASARVFAQVRLAAGIVAPLNLPRGAVAFLTRSEGLAGNLVSPQDMARAVGAGALVFEPLHDARLHPAHQSMRLHAWGEADAVLAAGTTGAWLRDPGALVDLHTGDLLVLVQALDPATGRAADADPGLRQAVQLVAEPEVFADPLEPTVPDPEGGPDLPLRILRIRWAPGDALGFALAIGSNADGEPLAEVLGNIVVADHGYSLPDAELLPPVPSPLDPELPDGGPKPLAALDRPRPFRPTLARRDVTVAGPAFDPAAAGSAAAMLATDPARAMPAIALTDLATMEEWEPARSLIGAGPDDALFVAETEADGTTRLRFGDDVSGRRPNAGTQFSTRYRVGGGTAGNIGIGALRHLANVGAINGIAGVSNPLPANGGRDRETVAEVRERAPVAFLKQKRAVTPDDYAALVNARPDVQRATARKRWIGSWPAIFVTVDRADGAPVDEAFVDDVLAYLEPYRLMGHDLAVEAPIFVPIDLAMHVCVDREHFADDVRDALEDAFSAGLTRAGTPGFFHPDNLTFEAKLYSSRIYAAAKAVEGVADVSVTQFRRQNAPQVSGVSSGVLTFGRREIPILANDRDHPSQGKLTIVVEGGR